MESPSEEKRMIQESLLDTARDPEKGGLKTMPFIIMNEAFEKVASFGLMPNMILYLMNEYNMSLSTGNNTLYMWSAATNFAPVVGAFLSDSFLGRFRTIGFGSVASLLGMVLLWLTAFIPSARPPHCNQSSQTCESPAFFQLVFLYLSFIMMSIGAGGVRAASMAFGADQLDTRNDLPKERSLESYFNWYNISATASVLVAVTCIVYIQDQFGWKMGFGIPALFMFFSALSFFLASSFYVKLKAKKSLLTGFAQVVVAAYKNRRLKLPSGNTSEMYHHKEGSDLMAPSNKVRCLNKACIISNPRQYSTPDKSVSNPWSLCTVDEVEELKALIKVIPMWSTGILLAVPSGLNTMILLQAKTMDRHIVSNFEIPAGSFGSFMIVFLVIWLAFYDRIILPLSSMIMGKPVHVSVKHRMGIGLLFSFMSLVVGAIVEEIRRSTAVQEGFSDNPQAMLSMSAMWLLPQQCLAGIAEAFYAVAQNEFFYSEFPKTMSSIALALAGLGMSAGNLLASLIFSTVDNATKGGGRESWVSSNLNKGHYDYYCWLLAGFSLTNFFYLVLCCRAYGPCAGEQSRVTDEEEGMRNK